MKAFIIILATLCASLAVEWSCPQNSTLSTMNGEGSLPPQDSEDEDPQYIGRYVGGMNCLLQLNIPEGSYAVIQWNSFPSEGDSLTAKNDYMTLDMYGVVANFYSVGPSPLKLTIKTASNTKGILRFTWRIRQYYSINNDFQVKSGIQSYLLQYSTNLFVTGNEKIAISSAMMDNAHPYTATGAVLFDGKTYTPYCACNCQIKSIYRMHTRIGEITPLIISKNATFYYFLRDDSFFGTNFEFSVNAYSDVEKFGELRLRFSSDVWLNLTMDASRGPSVLHLVNHRPEYDRAEISYLEFKNPNDFVTYSVRRIPIQETYLISKIGGNSNITIPQPITSANGNTLFLKSGVADISIGKLGSSNYFHTSSPVTYGVITTPYYTEIKNTSLQMDSFDFQNRELSRRSCFELLNNDELTYVEISNSYSVVTVLTNLNTSYCGEFSNERVAFKSGRNRSSLLESKGARLAYHFEAVPLTTTAKTITTPRSFTTTDWSRSGHSLNYLLPLILIVFLFVDI